MLARVSEFFCQKCQIRQKRAKNANIAEIANIAEAEKVFLSKRSKFGSFFEKKWISFSNKTLILFKIAKGGNFFSRTRFEWYSCL